MKKLIYLFVLVMAGMTSCDYTDIEPKGTVLPDNAQVLINLLRYDYNFGTSALPTYMLDDMDSNMPLLDDKNIEAAYNFENFIYEITETDGSLNSLGDELNRCNIALKNPDALEGTASDIQKVKSTAHLMRAHIYFTLANIYCPQYTAEVKDKENTGWPILLKEDYTANMKRSTLAELYEQIITDAKACLALDLDHEASIYGSRLAANGLLGYVYFQMGNYEEALPYINDCLAEKSDLFDYNTLGDDKIYEDATKVLNDNEILWFRGSNFSSGYDKWSPQRVHSVVSDELLALFADTNDLRSTHIGSFNGKKYYYEQRSQSGDASVTVPMLLIMKAECLVRTDKVSLAMNALNTLREKRFKTGTAYELSTTDKDEALKFVYEELRREVPFTNHRFQQIRRLNALHNANISITRKHIYTGVDIKLEANDPKWTLAIPRKYIEISPEMVQNPR